MTKNIQFDHQSVFEEIVARGLAEGVTSREAYSQLVENILDGHAMWGEMHDDQDQEAIEDVFRARWPEYEERLNSQEA